MQARQFKADDYAQFLGALHILEVTTSQGIQIVYPAAAGLAAWINQVCAIS